MVVLMVLLIMMEMHFGVNLEWGPQIIVAVTALLASIGAAGIPHALVEFPDEGHGFRKAPNVVRALEAELAFFAERFGFQPADDLPTLEIHT